MLERALEQARSGNDHHLAGRVRMILTAIEVERDGVDEMVEDELEGVEGEHPLIDAIKPLKRWIEEEEYHDGAEPAIEHLDTAFQTAREDGWQDVAVFSSERLLRLRLSVGRDADSTFEEIVDFLESEFDGDDIHLGNFHSLVDLIIEHSDQVGDSLLERCIEVCEERREIQAGQDNYRAERDTIEQLIGLKEAIDEDIEGEEERLIGSFQNEIDRRPSFQGKGAILKGAITRCSRFLNEDKEREWKRELREVNRTAVQEEFAEISPPDDVAEEAAEEAEENVERMQDWFRSAAEADSSTYALYCLLKSDGYFPDWETIEEIESDTPLSSILPRVTISPEGDPIETEGSPLHDEDAERIPSSYKMQMRHLNLILVNALYGLTENGDITETNFICLLSYTNRLSPDDQLFLMDLITAVFEERYPEAIHLGMSRMESVASTLLEETGASVTSVDGTDIQQAGLGGLLRTVEDDYSEGTGYYLRVKYAEKSGENLRNRTNHGQLLYDECHFMTAMLLLFDIFQLLVTVSESEYTEHFGVPQFRFGS